MRLVFEDSRWKLREARLDRHYNIRTSLGNVLSYTGKTIAELADIVATATGLDIDTGTLPSIQPGAAWTDLPADKAMTRLLRDTGCRLVYNPVTGYYRISQAATGPLPSLNPRVYRPGPPSNLRNITIQTAPIMYESRMTVNACTINRATGDLNPLGSPIHLATTPNDTEKQTILRLWSPFDDTKVLLPFRPKSHVHDPLHLAYERGRIIRDAWEPAPYHKFFVLPADTDFAKALPMTHGGQVFVTDHPVLMTDSGGELLDQATLLTGYLQRDASGNLQRSSTTVTINPAALSTITETIDWLRPVSSSEVDMTGSVWSSLLTSVANAIAAKHQADAQTVRQILPQDFQGSGQIGAVAYRLSSKIDRPYIYTDLALNFIPGSRGAID
jgi:hypothetical protein